MCISNFGLKTFRVNAFLHPKVKPHSWIYIKKMSCKPSKIRLNHVFWMIMRF